MDKDLAGPINGYSSGTVSIREILDYIEARTGKKAILSQAGDIAPYNGEPNHSRNTDKATALDFTFSNINN